MSIEAYKCMELNCKGYLFLENDVVKDTNITYEKGIAQYDCLICEECGKDYYVVPSYEVISLDETTGYTKARMSCIEEADCRRKMVDMENEKDVHKKIEKFIKLKKYSYEVEDVFEGYFKMKRLEYISYTMKDCVYSLKDDLDLYFKNTENVV